MILAGFINSNTAPGINDALGSVFRSAKLIALAVTLLVAGMALQSGAAHAADADEAKVKAYIKQQKAASKKPKDSSPNWKKGYTCNDLKKQSFEEYQECRYYYEVNGRFYPG